jgi:hypothetical protein
MRFSTKQHPFDGGLALPARTMSLCLLHQEGELLGQRHMPAGPAPFRKAMTPYREDVVVWGACLFTWDWLAALCAREGRPCVRGPAWSMQALQGGHATNDTMDAPTIAVLLRGGLRPQADVSPAERRATRALLRRRRPLRRQRAEVLGPSHNTHSQDHVPASGQQIASKAHRDGVAERLAAPAVQQSIAVALALLEPDDGRRRAMARPRLKTAQPQDATPRSVLAHGPGDGCHTASGTAGGHPGYAARPARASCRVLLSSGPRCPGVGGAA